MRSPLGAGADEEEAVRPVALRTHYKVGPSQSILSPSMGVKETSRYGILGRWQTLGVRRVRRFDLALTDSA